ncbi:MAG TPA: hypothetical protein DCR93_37345 [Cytophagales bacterium]|nr:hypothetical protein [Cytophagales bacterium]
MSTNGTLSYLKIEAYKDKGLGSKDGEYEVMLNPEKFTENFNIEYNTEQAPGTPDAPAKFNKAEPGKVSFDLIFDGTGVIDLTRTDISKEIKDFKKVVYDYNGDIHCPNFLKLTWGKALQFNCRLESLSIEYTLFSADGSPLRAKAQASFVSYTSAEKISQKANKKSPDMTHRITVKKGDSLPALTEQVYGDGKYFVQVARHNRVYNFRNLTPGTVLTFPPLA